jgi:hypothetical protein
MLAALIVIFTGGLSVFFLIGKVLTEYGARDINRIKHIQHNVYIDIIIAGIATALLGYSDIVLYVYNYLTFKFMALSIMNLDLVLDVDVSD